ncbi:MULTISPECIES: M23 family metallopeptidase [Luteimonas]|uniref:M23 family metallopeptidase n=1 Tax=Luteimonas TaxID=83614 RepID=UPI001E3C4340|nr:MULTISPECIES: M23 family metallopeptidase [Luteimonas]
MRRLTPPAALARFALLPTLLLSATLAAQSPSTGGWQGAAATADMHAQGVRLRLATTDDGVLAIADNPLAGPVEVLLLASGSTAPRSVPALPARATVPARGSVVVARLLAGAGIDTSRATLRLQAVPGVPGARPRDVEYRFPLRDAPVRVTQGFGGGVSHADDENRHAVDFAVDEGTPVLAARDGTVMQAEARVAGTTRLGSGQHADAAERANFIRILHDDGTMALYAHLQRGGVVVAPGDRVRRGAVIGFSGNTGASSGPHLHFVLQANHGLRLVSVPFRMFGPGGILRFDLPPAADASSP